MCKQSTSLARILAAAAVAALAITPRNASAQAYFSATGTFSGVASYFTNFNFSVSVTSDVTFRTWAWAGGINSAGQIIPPGGVDSVLTLFNSGNTVIAQNQDIAPDQ